MFIGSNMPFHMLHSKTQNRQLAKLEFYCGNYKFNITFAA